MPVGLNMSITGPDGILYTTPFRLPVALTARWVPEGSLARNFRTGSPGF